MIATLIQKGSFHSARVTPIPRYDKISKCSNTKFKFTYTDSTQ